MFDPGNIFNAIFVIPILNGLIAVYKGLQFLHIPGALGFALIVITILIRLLLHPLTVKQLRSAKKLNKLKPELDKLNKLYKDDKTKLHQEQLKLYQEAGINPAAGCLPLLLQMPILIAIYNLFYSILGSANIGEVVQAINRVVYAPFLKINELDLSFFGLHLTQKPNEWQKYGWWLLAIPLITGLLQYYQTKMMTPKASVPDPKLPPGKKTKLEEKIVEKKEEDDMAVAMQKQMTIMMPLMIGFFAYSFPLGLSLYWNTFTIFGIIQQHVINKEKK